MTNLAILGAAGRMGRMLIKCAADIPGVRVSAAIEQPGHPQLGQDAGLLAGLPALNIPLAAEWPDAETAHVVVDFTFHAATANHLRNAATNNQGLILGTTGHTDDEKSLIHHAAREIPIVYAANFSFGVNLLLDLVQRAAAALDTTYDAEIIELHHRLKKDAPSGTALSLAQSVADGRGVLLNDVANYGRHGIVGERPVGEISLHAVRGGDIVGDHTVLFAALGERIEITHKASSRECFATGALRAAQWLQNKPAGLYTMRHVLGLQ